MVALVAFWILAGRQNPSQLDRVFPHPTGNNAIEDYVQAAELLTAGHFALYQSWQPPERRPSPEQLRQQAEEEKKALEQMDASERAAVQATEAPPSSEEVRLTDHLNTLSFLQVKQEEVKEFGGVLELLASGNRKAVAFPTESSDPIADSFVWLAGVKMVTKFAGDAAFVAFSEGQPDRAVAILDEGLIMAHRVGSASLIGQLVDIASTSILLSRFNEQMGCLSLSETKDVERLTGQLLDDMDTFRAMTQNEGLNEQRELDHELKETPNPAAKDGTLPFSAQQILAVQQRLPEAFAARAAQSTALFLRPEEDWLMLSEPARDDPPPPNGTTSQLVSYIMNTVMPPAVGHQAMLAILRDRTQLRLLRLHALIREYRWETGSYPESLETMKLPESETYDPLSRKSFHYEQNDGAYRLYSLGIRETGIVELKYRMRPGTASPNDAVNPP